MSTTSETRREQLLLVDRRAGVMTLTLNRPAQFNALSEAMLSALQSAFNALMNDDKTRVVVLAANGKAFCTGHDLKQMRAHATQAYYRTLFAQCSKLMQTILAIPQPVIARVHGMATAAGCQLVATCDLAVAAESATFAVSGINVGLFCSTPAVALSRNVARKQAFEMLISGDFIDAHTAREKGLVNRVTRVDQLDAEIAELCDSICAKPPVAVRTGKQMFYQQIEYGVADAYAFAGETMAQNMMAADTLEGVDAFIEKRAPDWTKP